MPRLQNGKVVFPENGPELPEELKEIIVGPRSEHRKHRIKKKTACNAVFTIRMHKMG